MGDPAQEVRIERQNHVRVLQLVLRVDVAAERRLRRRHRRIAVHRLPLDQLRLRILRLHLLPLRGQRGRGNRLAQEVNALCRLGRLRRVGERLLELAPTRWPARGRAPPSSGPDRTDRAASPGSAHPTCPSTSDGPGLPSTLIGRNASDFTSTGIAPVGNGKRRGKVHRLAQDQVLGRFHIGEDRLVRLLGASGQPGQRQRRAHHLQEAAPADRIDPLPGLPRETPASSISWKPGVSASSSRFFQKRLPVLPSSLARTSASVSCAWPDAIARHQLRAAACCSVFHVLCLCLVFIGGMSRNS